MELEKLVVLTGAGISAESGIRTFRDSDGLWEGHNVMDVATPEGFRRNPDLVHAFYNARRKQLSEVEPNEGHHILAKLEEYYDVCVITQNVDNLHERAGSSNVIHLHGQLTKVCSTRDKSLLMDWDKDLATSDRHPNGDPLRPFIVWFGEDVPELEKAAAICATADILVVTGTSLQVYPAASLMYYARPHIPVYYIDPKPASISGLPNPLTVIPEKASEGMPKLYKQLLEML